MHFCNTFSIDYLDELNPLEVSFKSLYSQYNNIYSHAPYTLSEIEFLLSQIPVSLRKPIEQIHPGNLLNEGMFFPTNIDVCIHRHDRYSPAIMHSHDFIELICVLNGQCTNYLETESLHLATGDICIIAPDTNHAIQAASDDAIIYNLLIRTSTFQTAFFEVLSDDNILSDFFLRMLYHSPVNSHLLFKTGNDPEFYRYIGWIYSEYASQQQYKNRMLINLVSSFFVHLLRKHSADVQTNFSVPHEENIVYVLRYLQMHYKTLTLNELSNFFGYSTRQMQRLLHASTGLSFRENILKLKMNEAQRLLENSSLSVDIIAERLGYSTAESFRHTYKNYFGHTPSVSRKKRQAP